MEYELRHDHELHEVAASSTSIPPLLPPKEAAAQLGKSLDWMYEYARDGHAGVYRSSNKPWARYEIDPTEVREQMRRWAVEHAEAAKSRLAPVPDATVPGRDSVEDCLGELQGVVDRHRTVA